MERYLHGRLPKQRLETELAERDKYSVAHSHVHTICNIVAARNEESVELVCALEYIHQVHTQANDSQ